MPMLPRWRSPLQRMGVNALYASWFEPSVRRIGNNLPKSQTEGPDYLGVLRFTDIPKCWKPSAAAATVR